MRIAVIYGGKSGEHEVSLQSAASIMAAFKETAHAVVPMLVPKDGAWPFSPAELAAAADVAFPIIHGTGGEDGALQGFLELADVPYVGSGVAGSALNMDKVFEKQIFAQHGFPVVPYMHFMAGEWADAERREKLIADVEALGYPCFVKPANLGSSVGISKAHHRTELLAAVEDALRYDRKVIVEQGVPQAREIECAVLGNDAPHASVLGEIVPSNEFYDYAAKYVDGKSAEHIPADLPHATAENIRTMAVRAFTAMGCSGLARVDFFLRRDTGEAYLNEINTLPGFTSISMYPKLWAATGKPYPQLLDELVRLAVERHAEKKRLLRSFSPPAR